MYVSSLWFEKLQTCANVNQQKARVTKKIIVARADRLTACHNNQQS